MKDILKKYCERNRSLGLYSSDDYAELINNKISVGNIKCEECIRQLWNDTTKNPVIKRTTPFSTADKKN